MFFSSKKREERQKERTLKAVVKEDPMFQNRLNNEHRIVQESIGILSTTKNLSTLVERYHVASVAYIRLNDMFLKIGDDSCIGLQEDIDALIVSRLPEVVGEEVSAANRLKTEAGRRGRLNGIIQSLESCDRLDNGSVDEAIQEEESKVFAILDKGVDWDREEDVAEVGFSEDMVLKRLKAAVMKSGIEKGLTKEQISDILKKTFE